MEEIMEFLKAIERKREADKAESMAWWYWIKHRDNFTYFKTI
jgi:hypothetical protein